MACPNTSQFPNCYPCERWTLTTNANSFMARTPFADMSFMEIQGIKHKAFGVSRHTQYAITGHIVLAFSLQTVLEVLFCLLTIKVLLDFAIRQPFGSIHRQGTQNRRTAATDPCWSFRSTAL